MYGRTLDPDELAVYDFDAPERDQHLLSEHSDYTDFPGCMLEKGWERVEHAPFDVANRGRENYLRANVNYDYDPADFAMRHVRRQNSNEEGDFGDLNN